MNAWMPTDPHEPLARASSADDGEAARAALGRAEVRKLLVDVVRRRVAPSDVDDVVQTVLCEALGADRIPGEREELRRWLTGIARHKIADHHRRRTREAPAEIPELPVAPPPIEERELARWAEKQAPETSDARRTLDWMAREGEGEKLETIAAEEQLPAARVRQRVSRLRRWMKERWLAELAAVAALALLALVVWRFFAKPGQIEAIHPDPAHAPTSPVPDDPRVRAHALRGEATEPCLAGERARCLELLDQAKTLDPAGDAAPEVQELRRRVAPPPSPPPVDSSAPVLPKAPTKSDAPAPVYTPKSAPKAAPKPMPTSTPSKSTGAASKKVLGAGWGSGSNVQSD